MSGIEVAGLFFGVLPILIEAVKAYGSVSDGLRTFRHWSREVKSISLQLKVQNGIFLNECRLLLRLIEDDKAADAMLDDEADQRWASKELNDRLNTVLKHNLELCCSIIEETKETVDEMRKEMSKFDVLQQRKQKDEKIKAVIKRLRGAISIAFDKSKYERCLASLRDRNGDLSSLRSHIDAFQQSARTTSALVNHKPLPGRFQNIRNASQKLHEALCGAWCCEDSLHRGHYAKLCLDAEAKPEVHLDLAISCHGNTTENEPCTPQEPPIWLYVQSMSVTSKPCSITTLNSMASLNASLPSELSKASSNTLKKKASADLTVAPSCKKKKSKQVHFDNGAVPLQTIQPIVAAVAQSTSLGFNLCRTKNICRYLMCNYKAYESSLNQNCVGYLETPQLYRHMFFAKRATATKPQVSTAYSIFDIMRQEADDVLEVEDQLKLAHKAAIAILQYNDTPWLSERWRLGQISYFGSRNNLDQTALRTLYLSSQLSSPLQVTTTAMDGVEGTAGVSDEIRYGINNLPLFFLGVALLEIAHWQPLEKKMVARDCNDQVYAARRLACGRAPLGPEYQKIVQKCLQCNFGFGTKLNSEGLQAAVYNDVVCELEGMLERLAL